LEVSNHKRHVITGGRGVGKTTLIDALRNKANILTVKEPAIMVLDDSFRTGSDLLPWIRLLDFVQTVTQISIEEFTNTPKGKDCFFR
jgi:predicted ATPase